ncbi:MAG: hypothetical protein AAGE37_11930 [Pseudomonadota bacterium]
MASAEVSLLVGCFQGDAPGNPDDESENSSDEVEVTLKLHPLKQYCVEYKHEGTLSGTSKQCIRNWGTESFTIENLKIGFGGITQDQNTHKIVIGKKVYNIDPEKMTGTVTDNPFYDTLSQADPEQLSQSMLNAMQLVDTGEDKQVAGAMCNIMQSSQVGSACFTDDMVMLEQDVMGVRQVATSVDLSSGGSDSDYRLYEKATITEGPDVGAILESL